MKKLPPWSPTPPIPGTYRSIFKWGNPDEAKHPNHRLCEYLRNTFHLSDENFNERKNTGELPVKVTHPSRLTDTDLADMQNIVGEENVMVDEFSRASHCYGKAMLDLLRLRAGIIENPPDAVVHPRNHEDIQCLLDLCNSRHIPVVAFGGGTSVTRGVECTRGGISLDMRTHMNQILQVNPVNQTAKVQPGISGPALEQALNEARHRFGTPHAYTCGHFPQSFEFSTIGGWVMTRGAGQNSTYYGKIENLVLSQKYITPIGEIVTLDIPAKATGPDLDQIMIGSEGAYGILVEVTLKIFRYRPDARKYFSFVFPDWETALQACREMMQGEFGFPSVLRLSDPEETDIAFKLYGVEDTILDSFLKRFGYRTRSRCLLLGHTDGNEEFSRLVHRKVIRISKQHGALYTTGYVTKIWERERFRDPYLRDDLGDFGIVIDTLECGVNWSNLHQVWTGVRERCHSRPNTICMAHASHFYPQGANLYFIFLAKMEDLEEYLEFLAKLLDAIQRLGTSMSHHHGIGKLISPWLEGQLGKNQIEVLRALKTHFDPNNIMNPGGTLGLDLTHELVR